MNSYYVNSTYGGVVTFIPEHQLCALLDEINATFPEAKLAITNDDRTGGLVLDFEDLPKVSLRKLVIATFGTNVR